MRKVPGTFTVNRVELDAGEREELEIAAVHLCRLYGAGPEEYETYDAARQELIDLLSDLITDACYQIAHSDAGSTDQKMTACSFDVDDLIERMKKRMKGGVQHDAAV